MLDGLNTYVYPANPLISIDPLGLVDINLFPEHEAIYEYAKKVPEQSSVFKVGAHGNPELIVDKAGQVVSPDELAEMITSHPKYKSGMVVELLSCNTGQGTCPYAQILADKLGGVVRAPDQFMWYYSNGHTVPMGMTPDGQMNMNQPCRVRRFFPGKGGRKMNQKKLYNIYLFVFMIFSV